MELNKKVKIGMAIAIFAIVIGIAAAASNLAGLTTPTGTYYLSQNATYNGVWTDIRCNAGDQVISGGGDAGLNNGPGFLRESRPLQDTSAWPSVWRVSSINSTTRRSVQTQSPMAVCFHPFFKTTVLAP